MTPFEAYKANQSQALARIRQAIPFDLGTQKATKVRRALGRTTEDRTLLNRSIARSHGQRLVAQFSKRLGRLSPPESQRRLRFLTLLHEVVFPDMASVSRSVLQMEDALSATWSSASPLQPRLLGTVEIEIVNLAFLRAVASASDSNKRKLDVALGIAEEGVAELGAVDRGLALIHLHGLVDLGDGCAVECGERLRESLTEVWSQPYAVELKATFKGQPLKEKLARIATYLTKGGNEELRYKAGFRRDLPGDLDGKMWRSGLGRKADGGESVTDERGLTVGEVQQLHAIYNWLMHRRGGDDGYLIDLG